jgi:hypothetical protein
MESPGPVTRIIVSPIPAGPVVARAINYGFVVDIGICVARRIADVNHFLLF